jgi:hypothetical protein
MQLTVGGQAFDRHDVMFFRHDREHHACIDRSAVEQNGAGATLPQVATTLGSCQVQPVAQGVQ